MKRLLPLVAAAALALTMVGTALADVNGGSNNPGPEGRGQPGNQSHNNPGK